MRILHTADWHYGMRHYGMPQREVDMYKAGDHVVARAIALGVDAVILAGDIFDTPKPSALTVEVLAAQVRRLRAAGIEVLGIDGNHDTVDGNWLKVCNVTPVTSDHTVTIKGVSFLGINSMRPTQFKQTLDNVCKDTLLTPVDVLIIHQAISEMCGFVTQDLTALDISTTLNKSKLGVKVVAMGDIHNYAEMVVGGVRFIYSGSIETTAANDVPNKSFSIIDIVDGVVKTSYEPIPIRPFYQLTLSSEADLDSLVKEMDKYKDGLVIIKYEIKDRTLALRAEAILDGKPFLYKMWPLAKLGVENLAAQLNKESFERRNSLLQLRESILAFFEDKSDQFELVTQMLSAPANVDGIVKQYMASKGLK